MLSTELMSRAKEVFQLYVESIKMVFDDNSIITEAFKDYDMVAFDVYLLKLYLIYVASDSYGKISTAKKMTMGDILNEDYTQQFYNETIDCDKVKSVLFETIPFSLKVVSEIMKSGDYDMSYICYLLVDIFGDLGKYIILADLDGMQVALDDPHFIKLNEYVNELNSFIKENIPLKYQRKENSDENNEDQDDCDDDLDFLDDLLWDEDDETKDLMVDGEDSVLSKNGIDSNSTNNQLGTLDNAIEELNNLIGLSSVKDEITSLIHLLHINSIKKGRGLKEVPVNKHLVFSGNPGTGKTTVARLLAKIYYHLGVTKRDEIFEVAREDLVAGYVGQTAIKTQEVIDKALGGILFIDEAYSLTSSSDNDFGKEAINVLLKEMEDNRDDLVVIVAGYPDLMEKFVTSNPGLKSRFSKTIYFEDYTAKEMLEILEIMCEENSYTLSELAKEQCLDVFNEWVDNKTENFANAREVRNYFERAVRKQATRLYSNKNFSDDQLTLLIADDF